jgi:hypothetical protein
MLRPHQEQYNAQFRRLVNYSTSPSDVTKLWPMAVKDVGMFFSGRWTSGVKQKIVEIASMHAVFLRLQENMLG